jgi:glycosyltransferase involved in cell wall biosynthesis
VAKAVRQCRKILLEEDIAAILTTSPPHSVQLVGYFLKRQFPAIPWIADFRDLWSQSHLLVNKKLPYRVNYFLEKRCLKAATRALVVTEGIRRLTLEKFPRDIIPEASLITLTNGYDPSDMASLPPTRPNDKLTLTFTGSLYEARSQTEFIPALEELMADETRRDQVRIRFTGFFPPGIQRQMQKLCEMGVAVVRPPVPRQEALTEMAQANALLLLEADIPELRLNHSNKLFEYMATGKPIFAIVPNGEAARLIQEEKAGMVVHPNDREGIKQGILKLLEDFKRGAVTSAPGPDKYARYQRRNLSQSLAHILDQCVDQADRK